MGGMEFLIVVVEERETDHDVVHSIVEKASGRHVGRGAGRPRFGAARVVATAPGNRPPPV
jgi:hypothetical protein